MYQALADGWVPPTSLSEEEYRELKVAEPSALRGFAGFGCSFGGKWFDGFARGGGRDHANESYKALVRQAPTLRGRQFMHQSYDQFQPGPGDVVYLDPLYMGTTAYKGTPCFDHDLLWNTARRWRDRGTRIYVSEFNAPEDFECIWEKERKAGATVRKGGATKICLRTERLYR